jgi:hypothetical protein
VRVIGIKINSTIHFFSNSTYNRKGNASNEIEQYNPQEIRTVRIIKPKSIYIKSEKRFSEKYEKSTL